MNPLFAQGVELMLVGMAVVFAFLVLLVGAVSLMSRLLARFAPEPVPPPPGSVQPASPAGIDERLLTVIRAAVRQHRGQA